MNVNDALEYVDPTDANCAAEIAEAGLRLAECIYQYAIVGHGVESLQIRNAIIQQLEDMGLALRLDQHNRGVGWDGIAEVLQELD